MNYLKIILLFSATLTIFSCTKEPRVSFNVERQIINTLDESVIMRIFHPSIDSVEYIINPSDTLVFEGRCSDNGDGRGCFSTTFPEGIRYGGEILLIFNQNRTAKYGLTTCDSIDKNIATSLQVAIGLPNTCGYFFMGRNPDNAAVIQYEIDSVDYSWAR